MNEHRSRTDEVHNIYQRIWFPTGKEEEDYSEKLARALVEDIQNGFCPMLERWYIGQKSMFSRFERNAIFRAHQYLFPQFMSYPMELRERIKMLFDKLQINKSRIKSDADKREEPVVINIKDGEKVAPSQDDACEKNEAPLAEPEETPAPVEEPEEVREATPEESEVAKDESNEAEDSPAAAPDTRNEETARLREEIAKLKSEIELLKTEKAQALKAAETQKARLDNESDQLFEQRWAKYREEREASLNRSIEEHKKAMFEECDRAAEARYYQIVKEKLGGYLQNDREGWRETYNSMNESCSSMAKIVCESREAACSASSKMQREMKEYMDRYMVEFFSTMDKWRNSLYSIQLDEFSKWYARFCGFVDRYDNRVISGADGAGFDEVVKVGKSLKNLRNSLERILPTMGLRSFYPQSGDIFDVAYHMCDCDIVDDGTRIISCENPGVELIASDDELNRVLVKAEVVIEGEEEVK